MKPTEIYPIKPPTESQQQNFGKFLVSNEKPVVVTGIADRFFWSMFIRYLLLSLFIIGIPNLVRLIRQKVSFHYIVTNRRFLIVQGILARKVITAPLSAITHITVEQSLTERFFYNCGQVVVITAGYDPREIVIEHISSPVKFKVLIEDLTHKLTSGETDLEEVEFPLRPLQLD